ncbi:MAG TPA: HYR domain-containing protein, partial [Acidimicrobiia bacterium]|nr:HYR domain-containing protein [Acidimicrobiia bacterium]
MTQRGKHLAPTIRRVSRTWVLPLTLVMLLVMGGVAWADNVQNDVTVGGNDTFTVGNSTTVNYRIASNNGDGQIGCNAADTTAATVTINTPAGVIATPDEITFTSCGTDKSVVFTATAVGAHEITVGVSDGGEGSYNTNPAKFTLHVQAAPPPSNTRPVLTLPANMTVEGNTLGGADVTYTAAANDTQDGALTPACSPASGSFFALGGPHTVNCSVTDTGGLSANGSFTITVVDTIGPVVTGPADATIEGNTAGG